MEEKSSCVVGVYIFVGNDEQFCAQHTWARAIHDGSLRIGGNTHCFGQNDGKGTETAP